MDLGEVLDLREQKEGVRQLIVRKPLPHSFIRPVRVVTNLPTVVFENFDMLIFPIISREVSRQRGDLLIGVLEPSQELQHKGIVLLGNRRGAGSVRKRIGVEGEQTITNQLTLIRPKVSKMLVIVWLWVRVDLKIGNAILWISV